jgi:hypothetical protein
MKTCNTNKITALISAVMFTLAVSAQTKTDSLKKTESRLNKFAIGYCLTQYQNDFGVGMNLTTPYIVKAAMAFRLTGSVQWLQNMEINQSSPFAQVTTTWSPYAAFRLSVVSRQFVITNKISVYSEGGVVLLLPNSSFSSRSTQFGGFGVFGVEFHPSQHWAQYLEVGGIGTGAVADKAVGQPIYSNGLLINVGFRVYF